MTQSKLLSLPNKRKFNFLVCIKINLLYNFLFACLYKLMFKFKILIKMIFN